MLLGDRLGRSSRLQQFQLNIDAADRIEELKLEVTAPTIPANPSIATQGGVACFKKSGKVSDGNSVSRFASGPGH
jgi:hypothetical protein